MALEAFETSRPFTLGVELEIQIVDRLGFDLTNAASDLLPLVQDVPLAGQITPEITEGMIELSTGICTDHRDVLRQLGEARDVLVRAADQLHVGLAGGGTHPFQRWHDRQIFDSPRYQYISELYGYLAKQFTVFGQHVHVGCPNADDALFLLHALSTYVPHFIALSASSPYVQGEDTGFHSARLNSVFAFPLSGRAPFVLQWKDFQTYFEKMRATGVVDSMKDFYWDIRPKPGFGTIEVRVMDTPFAIETAAAIACYIQAIARWILHERPFVPVEDDYLVYTFNRFAACRFGLDGVVVDPRSHEQMTIADAVKRTLDRIAPHAEALGGSAGLEVIWKMAQSRINDAGLLRRTVMQEGALDEAVRQQCERWRGGSPQ